MKPATTTMKSATDIEQAFTAAAATEEVFTVAEIAVKWKKSENVVRRIFLDEPGVLRFGHGTLSVGRKYRRRYFSLRIPLAVFERVQDRLRLREKKPSGRAR